MLCIALDKRNKKFSYFSITTYDLFIYLSIYLYFAQKMVLDIWAQLFKASLA